MISSIIISDNMKKKMKFIDLFCGVGGFHVAMSSLGLECVFASDIDKDCRKVYEDNFGIEPAGDITKVDENDIPEHDVLCGGFPCQSFSKAGARLGMEDTRGTLFFEIVRIIKKRHPSYLFLENVRNLVGHDNGNTWRVISENLSKLGYVFQPKPIIFSPHLLGVPQFRERVIIIAKRKDLPDSDGVFFNGMNSEPVCNIDDILHKDSEEVDLKPYKLSADETKIIEIWDEFAKGIKDPLPGFPIWADEFRGNYDYSDLPKWKQIFLRKNRAFYENNKKFLDKWLKKHNDLQDIKPSRRGFEWQAQDSERDLWKLIIQMRPSGIRVKRPTYFPGLVAITQTSIVGKHKRKLTPREVARLQSFPDSFVFNVPDKVIYKQMGNSVNVEVIKFFASRLLGIEYKLKKGVKVNMQDQVLLPL